MGLLKETMQAIIHIDWNLAAIRKVLTRDDDKLFRATYLQKPIEQVYADTNQKIDSALSLFDRLPQLELFPYPDHLTFGGRIKAVRMFKGLTQKTFGNLIGVTFGHISNLEKDITQPSAMLTRSISMIFNINETWLTTGHLPQTTDSPSIAMGKVTPLSGYGGPEALKEAIDRQHQTRLEVQEQFGIQENPQEMDDAKPLSGAGKKLTIAESMDRVNQEIDARLAERQAQRHSR